MNLLAYFASLDPLRLLRNLPGGVAQGILWGLMALGVYITFRMLSVSDLTVEGSFATGGCVAVMLITEGMPAWLGSALMSAGLESWAESVPAWAALVAAVLAGALCGLVTGLLHTALGIPAILAGILTQLALYSINLRIMKMAANKAVSVDKYALTLSSRNVPLAIAVGAGIAGVIIAVLYWFFGTETGAALRATGNNPAMSRAQGINIDSMKVLGFVVSNAIAAFAGGLVAQYQGFADVNMGRGASVIGLAAVIIGDVLADSLCKKNSNFAVRLLFVLLGGIIYYCVVIAVLWLKLNSNDLKLFTAVIVAVFLALPYMKEKGGRSFAAKKGGRGNA